MRISFQYRPFFTHAAFYYPDFYYAVFY